MDPEAKPRFDECARQYDLDLHQGLAATGEDKDYFARARIQWLRRCLERLGVPVSSCIDFGCGIGSSIPYLLESFGLQSVLGLDVSVASLELARRHHASPRAQFSLFDDYTPDGKSDLVFCNGVFHHIAPEQRASSLGLAYQSLKPGGILALWENNPWNPGTRYVMSRIPFDRDAKTLSAPAASKLVRAGRFRVLQTDFMFIFPRFLKPLRVLEPMLSRLPLGGQYQILCRKPESDSQVM